MVPLYLSLILRFFEKIEGGNEKRQGLLTLPLLNFESFVCVCSGAAGSRTRVRIRNRNGFYMLSSCSVFRKQHGQEQNLHCFLASESFTQAPRQYLSYTSFTVTPLNPAATGQRHRRGGSSHDLCR